MNYIYLRKTIDWGSIQTIADYIKANNAGYKQPWLPNLINYINTWNRLFKITYFSFRQELKKIALQSIFAIPDAIIISYDSFCDLDSEAFLAPIDDDDWFSPHLFFRCQPFFLKDIIVWNYVKWHDQLNIVPKPGIWHETCNCMFKVRALNKYYAKCNHYDWIEDHNKQNKMTLETQLSRVDDCLSVYNSSVASGSNAWHDQWDIEHMMLRRVHELQLPALIDPLKWAQPYFLQTYTLVKALI